MGIELKDREGNWFTPDFEPTPEELDKWTKEGRVRALNNAPAEPPVDPLERMKQEREQILAQEFNNVSMPTKIARFGVSMLAPVSSAYAENKALNGEERALMPSLGAAAADVGLAMLMPVRLGMAGLRAAGVTMPRFMSGRLASSTGNKVAQAGIGAADNVANSVITTEAENVAGDRNNDYVGVLETGLPAAIGAATGIKKIQKMDRARGELAGSVPQNIRLNEKAGRLTENTDMGLGSTKNKESINVVSDMFSNPNRGLGEAVGQTAARETDLMATRPNVDNFDPFLTMPSHFEHPNRNMHRETNQAINASRDWILNDMVEKGYITNAGVPIRRIDDINDYLNSMINWNKNQMGIARSAVDEKAARELFEDIRDGIRRGNVIDGDGTRSSQELANLDRWKNDYAENLTHRDILAGMADKRAKASIVSKGGEYYPMRNIDPTDARNVNAVAELMPNVLSARLQDRDLDPQKQKKKTEADIKDPVEQYLYLAEKHGKDFGPASEFLKTLTKEQREQAMARMIGGE